MYIDVVPNRNSPPAVLLRQAIREGKKIRKVTVANLSDWPEEQVASLRLLLKGESLVPLNQAFTISRSLPHGHVAAALGTLRGLGLERILNREPCRERALVVAMIVARILEPASKLATMRGLEAETASSSLGSCLDLGTVSEEELYRAMDWLLERQGQIEKQFAQRHLQQGCLVLYDLTSTYFEGRRCPLAHYGHSRDERPGNLQIVFGLLTDQDGRPVAVEVFQGNTGDPKTVAAQVEKLRARFGLDRVILVGDRGMLTSARIEQDLRSAGLDWITALRSAQIRGLVDSGFLQLSLFDQQDLAEISHPDYVGERLIACRNPLLAEERSRKRLELLAATEKRLEQIVAATRRKQRPLQGKEKIGIAIGKALGRYKMSKHFQFTVEETSFTYERNLDSIAKEAALDGIYVLRTSVAQLSLSSQETVRTYKRLSVVERAFRSMKSVDLKVRPIHHHLADRVRAHVLLCMLAAYVEWHMKHALTPLLFTDEQPQAGE
ncbi:MAG TPA: IS1634 family transposase, partial [Ktedonobacteraceae bacterium]|nr:IS1634 family transposase [Ktedonobacteraceae bacterium]